MIARRPFLAALGATVAIPPVHVFANPTEPDSLLAAARELAGQPYAPNAVPLPPPFANLTYDAYRAIRPIPGRAAMLSMGNNWAVDLLPPGIYFPDPVQIEFAGSDALNTVPFSTDLFSFDQRYFDNVPDSAPGAGFSGLRLRHPLNASDRLDEVMVMQGASYFRAIGQAMAYGLSARAVALGTGGPKPEEFPRFTRLRLYPGSDGSIRLEAVIDSPSLAGHLDLTLTPGMETAMDVSVTIFPRVDIPDIGLAPLTSMYLKGPLHASVSDDFRPRVHDSDVLVIENGAGEVLWRPIANPARLETSAFADTAPNSFGLFQTARAFEDYQDTEARYHDRPSAIVRPKGDWGSGAVTLVEIPTGDEFMDNIVAFWRPAAPLAAGSAHRYDYALTWTASISGTRTFTGKIETRSGREHDRPGTRRYVIDFASDPAGLTPDVTTTGDAEISGASLFALPDGRGTRVTFLLTPNSTDSAELRLTLRDAAGGVSHPVWLHRWTRARDGGV